MDFSTKIKFYDDNVDTMAADAERISQRVRDQAFEDALAQFPFLSMMLIRDLPRDQTYVKHESKKKHYVFGDATTSSCNSDPDPVRMSSGKMMRIDSELLETRIELCIMACAEASLEDEIMKQETAAALVLLNKLRQRFWYGQPDLGQYGLMNHPDSSGENTIQSPFRWADASNNQIAMQIVEATDGMLQPAVVIAENIYRQSIGLSDESNSGTGSCSMRGGCIESIIMSQDGSVFNDSIKSNKDLNASEKTGNEDLVYYLRQSFCPNDCI